MPPSPCPSKPMSEMEYFLWECLNEPETIDSATVNNMAADLSIPVETGKREHEACGNFNQTALHWSVLTETKSQRSVREDASPGLVFRMTPEPRSARNSSQEPSSGPAFRESVLRGTGSWCDEVASLDQNCLYSSQSVDLALQALEEDLKACSVGGAQSANRRSLDKDLQNNHKGKVRKLSKKGQKAHPKK